MEFFRQEYWNGCHFLLQGIHPTRGSNPYLLHWQVDSLPLSHWEAHLTYYICSIPFRIFQMDRFLSLSFHCYISNTKNNSQHPVNAVEGNREEGRRKRRRDGRKEHRAVRIEIVKAHVPLSKWKQQLAPS